ncbi:MAG TPA: hypothetical protein VF363_06780 [Candidatus Eisenbacteria bacterium]
MRGPVAALVAPLVISFAIVLVTYPSTAAASCGSESCPLDHASRWDQSGLSFELTQQYIDQDQPRVGTSDAAVGAISAPEDEVRTVNRMTTASGTYRPAGGAWSFSATLPFVSRTHEHIHNGAGGPEYQRWSYSGIGDLQALAVRKFGPGAAGGARYYASAGVKAPTGARNVEEVDGDQPEPPARLGTGSWDFLAGVGSEWRLGSGPAAGSEIPLRLSLSGRVNGRGTERYRVGSELTAHAGTEVPLIPALTALFQTNLRVHAKDDVGDTDSEASNTGGTVVYASPGLRLGLGGRTSLSALVQFQVYQRVNGIQLVSRTNLYFSLTRAIL